MALPNEPLTRGEQYLNRTATGGGTIPEFPLTRAEQYLNKIATGSGDTPEQPLTRMEQYLDYIAENGGGGGGSGGGGVFVVNITGDSPSNAAFDKTAAEVFVAKQTIPVVVTGSFDGITMWSDLAIALKEGTNYTFYVFFGGNHLEEFAATSDDGYPTVQL